MPKARKHQARRETLNEFFADDLASYCEKNGYKFDALSFQTFWLVVASADGSDQHFPALLERKVEFDLLSLILRFPEASLAVMLEMHRLLSGLNEQKRRALCGQDHYRKNSVAEAHRFIVEKQEKTVGSEARANVRSNAFTLLAKRVAERESPKSEKIGDSSV